MQTKGKKIHALNLRVGSLSACSTETQELIHATVSSVSQVMGMCTQGMRAPVVASLKWGF